MSPLLEFPSFILGYVDTCWFMTVLSLFNSSVSLTVFLCSSSILTFFTFQRLNTENFSVA